VQFLIGLAACFLPQMHRLPMVAGLLLWQRTDEPHLWVGAKKGRTKS